MCGCIKLPRNCIMGETVLHALITKQAYIMRMVADTWCIAYRLVLMFRLTGM